MDKFLCICGVSFKNKTDADLHVKLYEDMQQTWPHQILKRNWRARFQGLIFDAPWGKFFRLAGIYIIYMILKNHFDLNLTMMESILMGVGLGLIV